MTDEELSKAIDLVFSAVPKPTPENVSASVGPEGEMVQDFFSGKDWKDITLETLENEYPGDHGACLGFMTPEAFIYYFPAYLKIAAFSYNEGESPSQSLVCRLFNAAEGIIKDDNTEAINSFDYEQNKVVAVVLKKIADEQEGGEPDWAKDATNALNLRWGKYLNSNFKIDSDPQKFLEYYFNPNKKLSLYEFSCGNIKKFYNNISLENKLFELISIEWGKINWNTILKKKLFGDGVIDALSETSYQHVFPSLVLELTKNSSSVADFFIEHHLNMNNVHKDWELEFYFNFDERLRNLIGSILSKINNCLAQRALESYWL